jgi:hypothetical protein
VPINNRRMASHEVSVKFLYSQGQEKKSDSLQYCERQAGLNHAASQRSSGLGLPAEANPYVQARRRQSIKEPL